jgi:hypothetical protein
LAASVELVASVAWVVSAESAALAAASAELETPAAALAESAASAARVAVPAAGVALMADVTPPAWRVARAAKAATVRPLVWVDTHARAARAIAVRRASIRHRTVVLAAVGAVAAVAADVADRFDIYT